MFDWFWRLIVWARCRLDHPQWFDQFWEVRGYRRAMGGRWERWLLDSRGSFRMWMPAEWPLRQSDGRPIFAVQAEPLDWEDHS